MAGERRAREVVEQLAGGVPMDGGGEYFQDGGLARVDATHEIEFDDQADGLTFLRSVAAMRPSARKVDAVFGVDNQPQTVYFRTPKRFAVRERIYDKGVESGSHAAGLRVRIEAQRRFPKSRAIHHGSLDRVELGAYYAEKLQAYAQTDTIAAGPDQARRQLLAKVHSEGRSRCGWLLGCSATSRSSPSSGAPPIRTIAWRAGAWLSQAAWDRRRGRAAV